MCICSAGALSVYEKVYNITINLTKSRYEKQHQNIRTYCD